MQEVGRICGAYLLGPVVGYTHLHGSRPQFLEGALREHLTKCCHQRFFCARSYPRVGLAPQPLRGNTGDMAHLPILILSGALFLALVLACVAMHAAHRARAAARRAEAGARPADDDLAYVRDVLLLARREFDFHGGCVATDRPDLPLSPETSWTVDFSRARAAIDVAMDLLEREPCPWQSDDLKRWDADLSLYEGRLNAK